jgi:hypothetical protein
VPFLFFSHLFSRLGCLLKEVKQTIIFWHKKQKNTEKTKEFRDGHSAPGFDDTPSEQKVNDENVFKEKWEN